MGAILIVAYILNVLDAFFTAGALTCGTATEANPLMRWLWELHPYAFLSSKVAMPPVMLLFLYFARHMKLARVGAFFVLGVYSGIFVYHMIGLAHG